MISHKFEGLTNGETYYAKVFTANPNGRVNNREDVPAVSCVPSAFPSEPSEFELIGTYNNSGSYTVTDKEGWLLVELHGASGGGGMSCSDEDSDDEGDTRYGLASGGGGQGGGCAISLIKVAEGDSLTFTLGTYGQVKATTSLPYKSEVTAGISTCTFSTSLETYDELQVTGGANGSTGFGQIFHNAASSSFSGSVAGGSGAAIATGGNYANYNGSAGSDGVKQGAWHSPPTLSAPSGGAPGYTGGNYGGSGRNTYYSSGGRNYYGYCNNHGIPGSSAFIKIYRGNTNVVA